MAIRQNIDVDKLNNFRNFLQDNPDKGMLTLEAKGHYEGQAGRSTVHIGPYTLDDSTVNRKTRHYTIPFGAWREVEEAAGVSGPTDRMEPVEMVLAATAACVINSITYNAARLAIDTTDLEVSIKTTVDPRVLFAIRGPEDHGACLGKIEYDVKVRGEISDDDLETIRSLCMYSPVAGMLSQSVQIGGSVARA